MPSLDDLRRVIRRIEGARPPRPAAEPVEQVVDGELLDTGQGTIVVVRREYPLAHRHGAEPLGDATAAPLEMLARAARVDGDLGDAGSMLFLDTETTGLAGGTGTYAFLVGAAWLDGDRLTLTQFFMRFRRGAGVAGGAGAAADPRHCRHVQRRGLRPAAAGDALRRPPLAGRAHEPRSAPAGAPGVDGWLADCRLPTIESELGLAATTMFRSLIPSSTSTTRAGPDHQAGLSVASTCCRWSPSSVVWARARSRRRRATKSWPASVACGSRWTSSGRWRATAPRWPRACVARRPLGAHAPGAVGRAARWEVACVLWEVARVTCSSSPPVGGARQFRSIGRAICRPRGPSSLAL
jgi:hypothetical protein